MRQCEHVLFQGPHGMFGGAWLEGLLNVYQWVCIGGEVAGHCTLQGNPMSVVLSPCLQCNGGPSALCRGQGFWPCVHAAAAGLGTFSGDPHISSSHFCKWSSSGPVGCGGMLWGSSGWVLGAGCWVIAGLEGDELG